MSSSLQIIAKDLRALRLAKGMTQQALADAAGISRTTLVQIEKGKDAQLSSIAMAGQVLGVTVGVLQESADMARRKQARADNQTKLAASREKHLKLAVKFALGGPEATVLKNDALRIVKLWQDKQLCSPVYIERWLKILSAKPMQIAQSLATMNDEWGPAMRQNTPFATSITAP
jgi:transcriptional regulator with XRE-family HTH domain